MAEDRIGGSNGVVFTNVRILDGSGDFPYTGEVVVQGNRIRQVARGARTLPTQGVTVIDGAGAGRRRADNHRRNGRDVDARSL